MVLVNKMSVDSLSDAELRSKLMEYGYPVGPVTQTTRKILVKKLKNLIETRGFAGTRHSLAARYNLHLISSYLYLPLEWLMNLTHNFSIKIFSNNFNHLQI